MIVLGNKLRDHMKETMKITVAPWVDNSDVPMNDVYTDLTLEKMERKAEGYLGEPLTDYTELFAQTSQTSAPLSHSQTTEREKILFKADPGMGKTSLGKKIGWDWAMGLFKAFSIVFFLFLKMVKPSDVLENVIIQQRPSSVAGDLTKAKLRAMLETFGSQCLLILDGYDEHDGFNDHVRKIVENKSLDKCHIILSSRPHSVIDIEKYFTTVVSVKGFSRDMAHKFASNILGNEKDASRKVGNILSFNPISIGKRFPLYRCPILLSFISLLVREQNTDLTSDSIFFGQIYTKMTHCLFTKYQKRKDIEKCHNEGFC